jgi:hypothetical protein
MLKEMGPRHLARGVRVGIHAPWISHLLFADDCMIFTAATQRGVDRVQTGWRKSLMSIIGGRVNLLKSINLQFFLF